MSLFTNPDSATQHPADSQPGVVEFGDLVLALDRVTRSVEHLDVVRVVSFVKPADFEFVFVKQFVIRVLLMNGVFVKAHTAFVLEIVNSWAERAAKLKDKGSRSLRLLLDNFKSLCNFLNDQCLFASEDCPTNFLVQSFVKTAAQDKGFEEAWQTVCQGEPVEDCMKDLLQLVFLKAQLVHSLVSLDAQQTAVLVRQLLTNSVSTIAFNPFAELTLKFCFKHDKPAFDMLVANDHVWSHLLKNALKNEALLRFAYMREKDSQAKLSLLKSAHLGFGFTAWMNLANALHCVQAMRVVEAFHFCQQIENAIDCSQVTSAHTDTRPPSVVFRNGQFLDLQVTEDDFASTDPYLSSHFLTQNQPFKCRFYHFFVGVAEANGKFDYCLQLLRKLKQCGDPEGGRQPLPPNGQAFDSLIGHVCANVVGNPNRTGCAFVDLKGCFISCQGSLFGPKRRFRGEL